MVTVHVLKPFYDLVEKTDREAGEDFTASEERAAHIEAVLPDYVTIEPSEDLTKLSQQKLVALARERGIQLKGRPTKAQLIDALTKE